VSEEPVLVSRHDRTLVITLNRPSARNAVDAAMATALAAAGDQLEADDDVAVGVLTGAGGVFSAGMDLKAFARGESPVLPRYGFGGITSRTFTKPLIAAVEGWALAGGFELTLACDLAVAGRGARFGLPEVTRGLLAAAGGLTRLPRRIPYRVAMEIALTGQPIDAAEAWRLGLLNRVVDDGAALEQALEMAAVIGRNAPMAVAGSKRLLSQAGGESVPDTSVSPAELAERIAASADALEGAIAFAERRSPVWRNR
jgi:enoyl-CoA hydratase